MKPNLGLMEAVIRIACGLTILTVAGSAFTRKPWCKMLLLSIFIGGLKTASGILRFCPVTFMCENQDSQTHKEKAE
ncbi:YgaP family membrane protein [Bacillus sp. NPDC077027]|uniref:YgaP family membrane protein n=1 Tax=Bacillus sp. NPDC077027 TaxID=3390548 RepID=UPI003D012EBB